MKTLTLIPFLLIIVSCRGDFCEDPDFEAAGLKICTDGNPIDPEEVEIIAKTVEQKIQEVYSQVPSNTFEDYKRNDIRVQFIDEILAINCEELEADIYKCEDSIGGAIVENFNIYKIYVRYTRCLANTSLDHELLHALEYFYLDGPQGEDGHSAPFMFKIDAKRQGILDQDTIEQKIYNEVRFTLPSCIGT